MDGIVQVAKKYSQLMKMLIFSGFLYSRDYFLFGQFDAFLPEHKNNFPFRSFESV